MLSYIGQDIHYLDTYNLKSLESENKLLQIAIEDARELFLRIEAGNYKDVPKFAPVLNVGNQLKLLSLVLNYSSKNKKQRSLLWTIL